MGLAHETKRHATPQHVHRTTQNLTKQQNGTQLTKYFIKYKYRFLLGIIITIIAQIFSLFTPKLISKSFKIIEDYS